MKSKSIFLSWSKCAFAKLYRVVINILTGIFNTERIKELNQFQAGTNGISEEDNLNNLTANIPVGRLGKPEEFGYLVAFLASEFSSYITGSNIPIDGGLIKSL